MGNAGLLIVVDKADVADEMLPTVLLGRYPLPVAIVTLEVLDRTVRQEDPGTLELSRRRRAELVEGDGAPSVIAQQVGHISCLVIVGTEAVNGVHPPLVAPEREQETEGLAQPIVDPGGQGVHHQASIARAVALVLPYRSADIHQGHADEAGHLVAQGIARDGIQGEDVDKDALLGAAHVLVARRDEARAGVHNLGKAPDGAVLAVGGIGLEMLGQFLGILGDEQLVVAARHEQVHVIIPRDETAMTDGTEYRAVGEHHGQVVLDADFLDFFVHSKKMLLQPLALVVGHLVHVVGRVTSLLEQVLGPEYIHD